MFHPIPICLMLERQTVVFDACRALFSAGSSTEINNAMMPMTTNSSTSVKPSVLCERLRNMT